jgi:hypothetical protein
MIGGNRTVLFTAVLLEKVSGNQTFDDGVERTIRHAWRRKERQKQGGSVICVGVGHDTPCLMSSVSFCTGESTKKSLSLQVLYATQCITLSNAQNPFHARKSVVHHILNP